MGSWEGPPFPGVLRPEGGAPFRGAPVEQPDAATTKPNRSTGEAPPRGDGGSALHTPSPSTRFGKVVVRRIPHTIQNVLWLYTERDAKVGL
jgi:hypothetical protein